MRLDQRPAACTGQRVGLRARRKMGELPPPVDHRTGKTLDYQLAPLAKVDDYIEHALIHASYESINHPLSCTVRH